MTASICLEELVSPVPVFCFGEPVLGLLLTWAAESISSCFCFSSLGKSGKGDVTRSSGSTDTVLVLDFFLSGSAVNGGVGDFVFPDVEDGKLRCLSWYLARFG